jgi:ketosteroid isomerase-like protein
LWGIPPYPKRCSTAILHGVTTSTIERSNGLPEATGLGLLRSDVELDVSELLDGRILRGREAVRAHLRSMQTDVFLELTMEVETIDERDDVLVALVRMKGVGRGSGVPVEMAAAWIATVKDGQVANARLTLDRDAALEAVAR